MNYWLQLSIEYANQKSYLDDLFVVYPTIPEGTRIINNETWQKIEAYFSAKNNEALLRELLKLDLFPIKDSYVAYLKRDPTAISRNPETVNRICGRLYEMSLEEIFRMCSSPKETNRQIGPLFRRWLHRGSLGIDPCNLDKFVSSEEDAILGGSDKELYQFAVKHLNYRYNKYPDLVARFNGKYIIGEAKFLTDYGGHQNAQFQDAINFLLQEDVNAIKVAILDGVLYIKNNSKMYRDITTKYSDRNIMSALVLRDFLYQV